MKKILLLTTLVLLSAFVLKSVLIYLVPGYEILGGIPFILMLYVHQFSLALGAGLVGLFAYFKYRELTIGQALKIGLLASVLFIPFTVIASGILLFIQHPLQFGEVLQYLFVMTLLSFAMTDGNASTSLDVITKVATLFSSTLVQISLPLFVVVQLLRKCIAK